MRTRLAESRTSREGHDVLGVDSSKEMILNAKRTMDTDPYKNERGKLEFQVSDFSQWEHPVESFDLVIFSRSLHHIRQPGKAVRKAHDLLKKDGQIICIEYAYDRLDKKTATWIYNVRRSLQQSGWYKSRKKLSDKIDQSVRRIMEEYYEPRERSISTGSKRCVNPSAASSGKHIFLGSLTSTGT